MNEIEINRITVLFNSLKINLRKSYDNDYYQIWNLKHRNIKFTDWVINETKKKIGECSVTNPSDDSKQKE